MIVKERNSRRARNRMEQAGDAAEEQMAFYLRRRYSDDPAVRVFNDLRVKRRGEVAQIDHLLIHKHGMIIIESKSVTGEVHINAQLEFVRVFGNKQIGMPSPIQQARRQADLLHALLVDHKHRLRRKYLLGFMQGGFRHCPIQVLVAISDQGIIERNDQPIPELHKADQIVDQANSIIARHRSAARLPVPGVAGWGEYAFQSDELERVHDFLLQQHMPSTDGTQTKRRGTAKSTGDENAPPHHTTEHTHTCKHCNSTELEIRFGRSYYFKCLSCKGNTAITNGCHHCGSKTKTRKRGLTYTAVCTACGAEKVFFHNPEIADA